ncbi:MAG TPA: NAD(P)-dependent alcohol dehydrogenase [Mycobacteriales bacterium]|jgi:NAD+-dependent secondary alcohol dehydrogenase Adh1|nr:NAD(P)-dependent alcohol dehydrogenase [Mycobacteriales bacterium]
MKAARLHEFHRPLVLEDVPDPEASGPFDVIVRIGAAGLCRTDLHIWEGQFDEAQKEANLSLPYSPGHENAGWVQAVGSAVTNVAVGDKVILHPLITCGLCRACRDGDDVHCDNSVFPGLFAPGGFAQYLKSGARSVIKIDDALEPTDVAPLADAGLTAYHAIKKALPLLFPGTTCAVIGAGGLGHIGIQCLRAMSATRIVVLDANEAALDLATEWGADETVLVDGDQVAAVQELTGGRGVDVVLDFVGESGAEKWGVDLLKRKGYYFVIGYGGTLEVPTMQIILTEINFIGNLVGSYNDLVELMDLAAQGKVKLHTSSYPLDEINTAISDLDGGRLRGRGILVP